MRVEWEMAKGYKKPFGRTIMYLDYGGGFKSVHVYQNPSNFNFKYVQVILHVIP